jgi:heterotetrameric sarcosine oxidase gamma subunit
MTLETYSDLPIASPLLVSMSNERAALSLSEITRLTLFHMRGTENKAAPPSQKVGDVSSDADGIYVRLRRDEFVLLDYTDRVEWGHFERATGLENMTLTDITHGRCGLLLAGQDAPRVLPKVCGLNFSDQAFPHMHAAQTSLAKVRTLIIRADIDEMPVYGLFVDRSLAQYVWDVVYDAGQEFGISGFNLDSMKEGWGLW